MKQVVKRITAAALIAGMTFALAACNTAANNPEAATEEKSGASTTTGDAGSTIEVQFWTAPQKVQYEYWGNKIQEFNQAGIQTNGKTIQMKVQQMPESPSSEAGIQNALATDTAPALSENINRGFAAILSASGAVYPLNEEEWFNEVITSRAMEEMIKSWEIGGAQYVLPLYVNPMVMQWNAKGLKALNITTPPETVADLKELIASFRENQDTMKPLGISHVYSRYAFSRPDQWWERWFDFQGQYASFTNGGSWVEGNSLVLDKEKTQQVFEFYGLLGDTLLTSELADMWLQDNVPVMASISEPWNIQLYGENNKTYGIDGDYIYGPNIVQESGDQSYCFADSKGMVLYKDKNITDEMHQGAVEFVKWVYSTENSAKTDLEWITATTMLPARGDLVSNPEFTAFMDQNIAMRELSKFIPYSVPAMAHDKMTDIQTVLGEKGLTPYLEQTLPLKDFDIPSASEFVDAAFEAMKQAGGLE